MSIHQKIRDGRSKLELTEQQFADAVGVSRGAVQQWEKEGGTAPTRRNQPAVARLLGMTVAQLMSDDDQIVEIGNFRAKKLPDEQLIPEFSTGGSMGGGLILRDQPGVIRGWSVNTEWINKNVKSHTGADNLCIVTGFGDSMKPTYNPGDPLLIDKGVTVVDHEGIFFFRVGNEGFIKRLQRIPGQGILVISDNDKYRDWTIGPDVDFQVLGKVVKAWCGDDF